MIEHDIRARQIITREGLENAVSVVMAVGGSTNAVLHLMAIAHEARVEFTLEGFDRIGRRVPHIVDSRPHGRFAMTDIDRVGGIPVVMRALLDAGLLHGDALTVTGKTVEQNLEALGEVAAPTARWCACSPTPSTPTGGSPCCADPSLLWGPS